MLGTKALACLFFVAALGFSEEQIAVAPLESPSSGGSSPAPHVSLAPRVVYDACDGTPEVNAQVQDVLNSLGDAMASAKTATSDNVKTYMQQVKDLTAKAKAIATAPDFQMDAEGQQFVYDWVIKKGEQAARFLGGASLPLSDLDTNRATCVDHPVYDISSAYFYAKAFGKCYDCDKVLEMDSQIFTVYCWLQDQGVRTGYPIWYPSLNLQCGSPTLPDCKNVHMPVSDISSLSSDLATSSAGLSTSDIPLTVTGAQTLSSIASTMQAVSTVQAVSSVQTVSSVEAVSTVEAVSSAQAVSSVQVVSSASSPLSASAPQLSTGKVLTTSSEETAQSPTSLLPSVSSMAPLPSGDITQGSLVSQSPTSSMASPSSDENTQSSITLQPPVSTIAPVSSVKSYHSHIAPLLSLGKNDFMSSDSNSRSSLSVQPSVSTLVTASSVENTETEQPSASSMASAPASENTQSSVTSQSPVSSTTAKQTQSSAALGSSMASVSSGEKAQSSLTSEFHASSLASPSSENTQSSAINPPMSSMTSISSTVLYPSRVAPLFSLDKNDFASSDGSKGSSAFQPSVGTQAGNTQTPQTPVNPMTSLLSVKSHPSYIAPLLTVSQNPSAQSSSVPSASVTSTQGSVPSAAFSALASGSSSLGVVKSASSEQASEAEGGSVVTTVVTAFTTYCPEPTTFCVDDGKCYTATGATTITVTDCPCTLTTTRNTEEQPTAGNTKHATPTMPLLSVSPTTTPVVAPESQVPSVAPGAPESQVSSFAPVAPKSRGSPVGPVVSGTQALSVAPLASETQPASVGPANVGSTVLPKSLAVIIGAALLISM